MDTNDGFFPEREVLRARRQRAVVAQPEDPSEARTRRVAVGFVLSVSIFTSIVMPLFVGMEGSWNRHITLRALQFLICGLSLILIACAALVAVSLWRGFDKHKER